jgi:ABC-type glycerol-3-phosphate transport system substrate-binding protein
MRRACALTLLAAMAAGAAHAAEHQSPPPAQGKVESVDPEFLEFLGSVDTEDEAWREYLENRPTQATAGKAADKPAPPSQPAPRQEKVNKS